MVKFQINKNEKLEEKVWTELKEGKIYSIPGDTFKACGDNEFDIMYQDMICGKCGNDTFKVKSIDRSCPGCGPDAENYMICAKCGAYND